ncbi:hypothetical protein, partial [Salmonella sp. s51228]|uniref:hypothetical protein n=1 Tax=Salmonella sp. s51228 TaxID=3159652 RepID=UPI003981662B
MENEAHCDFVKLRDMMLRINMEDLREITHTVHYELYRKGQLQTMGFNEMAELQQGGNVKDVYEVKKKQYRAELERKEQNLKSGFITKVKQKESELMRAEESLQEEFENLKRLHAEERKELEEKKQQLEAGISDFNKIKASYLANR